MTFFVLSAQGILRAGPGWVAEAPPCMVYWLLLSAFGIFPGTTIFPFFGHFDHHPLCFPERRRVRFASDSNFNWLFRLRRILKALKKASL